MTRNRARLEHPEIFDSEGNPLPSEMLVDIARSIAGNRLLLAFSGRDSLAAWLYLRDKFEIIPYFCYTVPHLSYDDEMLDYYERYFGVHIIRLPHPRTYALLNHGAWMPLDAWSIVLNANLPDFDFSDVEDILAKQYGLGETYLSVVGFKASDSLSRRRLIYQMGPIGFKRRKYYFAIWDWKDSDVKEAISRAGLKLSKSYLYFGSTGDGIDYNFVKFLRDNLPEDYRRVLAFFPMADIEIFRYEHVK
jgi:hypothetical protein